MRPISDGYLEVWRVEQTSDHYMTVSLRPPDWYDNDLSVSFSAPLRDSDRFPVGRRFKITLLPESMAA